VVKCFAVTKRQGYILFFCYQSSAKPKLMKKTKNLGYFTTTVTK